MFILNSFIGSDLEAYGIIANKERQDKLGNRQHNVNRI